MSSQMSPVLAGAPPQGGQFKGIVLVMGAALAWSFGGAIARFIHVGDVWTVVFWRCLFAALFLLGFMLLRDGPRGTVRLFRSMGLPGAVTGLCLATTAVGYVLALGYTTVANVVLFLATVPLMTALISWLIFRERISAATWGAIATVILGVAIMVWDSLAGPKSIIGPALAFMIALAFAASALMTRHFPDIRMTPAACFGMVCACLLGAAQASFFVVEAREYGLLAVFGCLNLGLGMALFVTGARQIAPALATLLASLETMLAPLWTALIHGEIPSRNTLVGGSFILAALVFHLSLEWREQRRGRANTHAMIPPPIP